MTDDSFKSGLPIKPILIIAVFLVLAFAAQGFFCAGGAPDIQIKPSMSAIGMRTPVTIEISEPRRGLTFVKVELVQGSKAATVAEKSYDAQLPIHFLGFQDRERCAAYRNGPQAPAWADRRIGRNSDYRRPGGHMAAASGSCH